MSKRMMIASDLDGTLLNPARQVTDRTRDVVARLNAAGWPFVIATARPVRDVRDIAAALGHEAIAICGNGSVCFDFARHAVIDRRFLNAPGTRQALTALRSARGNIRFGAERFPDVVLEHGFRIDEALCPDPMRVDALEDAIDDQGFSKIMVQLPGNAHTYVRLVQAGLAHHGHYEITVSCADFCEVMSGGVTKAAALARVAAELGFTAADVVAFGDMPNDLPMLAWAGTAVAVANAHPDLLAIADAVTGTNADDGVAHYLETLLA
ncbi:Cof-type HAD-IIB family hydrolase [Saccharopolyspora erythraea]|uniref:Cof-type HAD-IIB family hydrolase n=1 Tax=Saccharopolyspora erythraea TaxID=1836 RepID=UPI001BA84426|nr:Cof-type HAD-IIB family hydrolase [Saccharopolyspora erythraea]QUH04056.1 Cof-type HAD-IIB family hydrolase [Saccharopolyspora erythraea]